MAPGAIWLMKAAWLVVSGTCAALAGGLFRVYPGVAGPVDSGGRLSAAGCSPGMAAVPA
jgi:hypothetical protein